MPTWRSVPVAFLLLLWNLVHFGQCMPSGGIDPLGGMPRRCGKSSGPGNMSYKPIGSKIKVGDVEVYETGDPGSKMLLINAYDIFGMHPSTIKVTDMFAKAGGFRIALPDYFYGNNYPLEKQPVEKHFDDLVKFLQTTASWDLHAREITRSMLDHYKKAGYDHIGLYGTCWGGKVAMLTGVEMENDVNAVASIHGFNLTMDDVHDIGVPSYIIQANNDPDALPFFEVLESRFGDKVGHQRFEDVEHGFFSAKADFQDPGRSKRIDETIEILVKFFHDRMH